jgi:hypothetical protein
MEEFLARFWEHLAGRWTGPLALRLLLQPAMSTVVAVRDGLRDARAGRPPFLWTIFASADERRRLVREGISAVSRIALLAIALDFTYQLIVFGRIFLGEAVVVAILLAIVPYFSLRGIVNRIASR